jgi:acetate kinase
MDTALNKKSGLLGITEKYADRRDIENAAKEGDKLSELSIEMEAYRLKKYIGSYVAALGNVDAIVFTAGVGEHSPLIRGKALEGLEVMGIKIDQNKNNASNTSNAETCISADDSKVKVFVIPTDEELVMTEDAFALMKGTYDVHTNFTYSFQNPNYVNKAREAGLKGDIEKTPLLKDILAKA